MARMPRFLISHQQATYHVISRTALDGYPLGEQEKSVLLCIIQQLSAVYFCEVLGFCLMGNHFHLLVTMRPEDEVSDEEVKESFQRRYGDEYTLMPGQIPFYRQKWTSLSEYVKEIKQSFTPLNRPPVYGFAVFNWASPVLQQEVQSAGLLLGGGGSPS
ncbi:hypothetical protein AKJ60_00665 [candidate division MSBL1 archaeon SCGC-AAA385M11]|nr:hypothetical protein AKJ60_00665 [candidate division MSBL1 archaeon SCGC-AAA385M11]